MSQRLAPSSSACPTMGEVVWCWVNLRRSGSMFGRGELMGFSWHPTVNIKKKSRLDKLKVLEHVI